MGGGGMRAICIPPPPRLLLTLQPREQHFCEAPGVVKVVQHRLARDAVQARHGQAGQRAVAGLVARTLARRRPRPPPPRALAARPRHVALVSPEQGKEGGRVCWGGGRGGLRAGARRLPRSTTTAPLRSPHPPRAAQCASPAHLRLRRHSSPVGVARAGAGGAAHSSGHCCAAASAFFAAPMSPSRCSRGALILPNKAWGVREIERTRFVWPTKVRRLASGVPQQALVRGRGPLHGCPNRARGGREWGQTQ